MGDRVDRGELITPVEFWLPGSIYLGSIILHDVIREAIEFDDDIKAKIISFLAGNFLSIIGSLDPTQNYQLALFLVRIFNSCRLKHHLTSL